MKKSIFFICLVLFGCSKGSNNPANNQAPNTVSIGGSTYGTVVIGTQTWTTTNYNGAGGLNYNNGANNPTYGKLYTEAEAQAIVAPSGWRLATKTDFQNLFLAIGANVLGNGGFVLPAASEFKLMSTTDWTAQNGTNDLKFNAEPAGCFTGGAFKGLGMESMFFFVDHCEYHAGCDDRIRKPYHYLRSAVARCNRSRIAAVCEGQLILPGGITLADSNSAQPVLVPEILRYH